MEDFTDSTTDAQIGLWLAKPRSCDVAFLIFCYVKHS